MILKISAVVVVLAVWTVPSQAGPFNLFSDFFSGVMSPRQGRNSKLMNFGSEPENKALPLKIKADTEDESVKNIIEEIKKEVEQKVEEKVEHDLKDVEEAVTEIIMNDLIKDIVGGQDSIRDQFQRRPSVPQRQFQTPRVQEFGTNGYNQDNVQRRTGYANQYNDRDQYVGGRANGLSSDFGPNMGDAVSVDPEDNVYSRQPQLDQEDVANIRQSDDATGAGTGAGTGADAGTGSGNAPTAPENGDSTGADSGTGDDNTDDSSDGGDNTAPGGTNTNDDVRCVNKVMQVEETVYEERIKCQHTFTEKCHDTFITDYVPTQEKKCETSFKKNCHIYYKPMMFEENVDVCNEPLKKVCNDDIIGVEECKTHYETVCETRYRDHEVEQDEPVCEMVTERRCNGVSVPLPNDPESLRFRRQSPELTNGIISQNDLASSLGFLQGNDLANVGEDCEEWPVQKCRLEKRLVKKTNPETSCQKMPREICAPSNCEFQQTEKVCRQETRNLVQNIPSEQCDLEPQENCKMETVLVPRLVQQPNCIKVPKEVCVNAKTNPKKVKRPVIKEWCYRPSDLKSPSSRLALSQFFRN